ncbi:integrase_H2C2 domain-containing protein [Trichonephila clavipes]|nr:integrase_H2C2 domain-containing protein [Trichonephila clavipes]
MTSQLTNTPNYRTMPTGGRTPADLTCISGTEARDIPVCLVCVENKRLSLHPIGRVFLVASTSDRGKATNYKQFVLKRVIEIQSNSDPSDWHHCSGRESPADYVSRGANLETIINSQFWVHGPLWLCTTENNWPKNLNYDFSSTDPCESEEQVFTFACELNIA